MKTEVFDDPAAFRAALAGTSRQKGMRGPSGEGDRLAALRRLALHGFMPRWRAGAGHDFWHLDGRTTTAHESYRAAVLAAEREVSDGK